MLTLVCLVIVLILMQDSCMLCAERTTGSGTVLDALDGTPRRRRSCGISFCPFGDSVSVGVR
jgi:hypothetical protein